MRKGCEYLRALIISQITRLIVRTNSCESLNKIVDWPEKEEAGLRCGGRGKSEISSALRMCCFSLTNNISQRSRQSHTFFIIFFEKNSAQRPRTDLLLLKK